MTVEMFGIIAFVIATLGIAWLFWRGRSILQGQTTSMDWCCGGFYVFIVIGFTSLGISGHPIDVIKFPSNVCPKLVIDVKHQDLKTYQNNLYEWKHNECGKNEIAYRIWKKDIPKDMSELNKQGYEIWDKSKPFPNGSSY